VEETGRCVISSDNATAATSDHRGDSFHGQATTVDAEKSALSASNATTIMSVMTETANANTRDQAASMKVKLNCAVVEVDRRFLEELNENRSVRDLEFAISKLCAEHGGNPSLRGWLKLFVAKTPSSGWIDAVNVPFLADKSGKLKGVESNGAH
jgi:hypothetical protein